LEVGKVALDSGSALGEAVDPVADDVELVAEFELYFGV
jgi:hypothetical protein